jgi:hypothetical protein
VPSVKTRPIDFERTVEQIANTKQLTVNDLVKVYNVAQPVITRWLSEIGVSITKTNDKKENTIDFELFKQMVESGNYTKSEIQSKFKLTTSAINRIVKRTGILAKYSNIFNPDPNEFVTYLMQHGKQKTARHYNQTLSVVIGWCKRHNISLPKYHGRKRNDLITSTDDIIKLYKGGHTLNFIASIYNSNNQKIKSLLEQAGIEVKTLFDSWEISRKAIQENLQRIIADNKSGLSLQEIACKYSYSYEQLKRVFVENDIPIILHSYNKSFGELEVKTFIQSLGVEAFSKKLLFNNKRYERDCDVQTHNFGIEYCSEYWHSENAGTDRKYLQEKSLWANQQSIRLMTIFEHEWYTKQELLKSMIRVRLGIVENMIYARNTELMIVPKQEARKFHDHNHINGSLNTSHIDIGLYYKGELVSVASFGRSRFDKNVDWELLRFSTQRDTVVIGGFSKMFKHFLFLESPSAVLSYCDLRFGNGNVYVKSGFSNKGITPPNYWYYYKKDGRFGKFESRLKYQKHKLKHLSNYHDSKTEYEIMQENGFLKLYDCGNIKYIYYTEEGV